jgi:flagellar operon protein
MNWDAERIQANMSGPSAIRPASAPEKSTRISGQKGEFEKVLKDVQAKDVASEVKISAHAADRLMQRGIILDQADISKIGEGLDRASAKGAKESLFLLRDLALIVSVENRTVITALQGQNAKENVFTQIDSAVLL